MNNKFRRTATALIMGFVLVLSALVLLGTSSVATDQAIMDHGPRDLIEERNLGRMEEFSTQYCSAEDGCENFLFMEDFSAPAGWSATYGWGLYYSDYAGGSPPEAALDWWYIYYSTEYLISPVLDTSGADDLTLEFKQFVDWYANSFDIYVYAAAELADPWTEVYHQTVTENIGPETVTIDITDYIGSGTQVMFLWSGYWLDIDYWYIDDVLIYETPCEGVNIFGPEQVDEGDPVSIYGSIYNVDADGYEWYVDGNLEDSGTITSDPLFTTLDYGCYDPGLCDIELVATDGGVPVDSDTHTLFVVPEGDVFEITDIFVKPEDIQAGGLAMVYVDVYNTLPRAMPLAEDDLDLELPDGWNMLNIDGPGRIEGGATETLVAAISVPADEEIGEYEIVASIPYQITSHWQDVGDCIWWCGDDALGTYDDNWLDALVFHDVAVPDSADAAMYLLHAIQSEGTYDGGNVQISTDGGMTWDILVPDRGYDDDYIYGLDGPGFTSYAGYVAEDIFDLSAYAGMTVEMKFVFGSDYSIHYYDGWYIGIVAIGEATETIVPAEWTVLNMGDDPYGDTWEWDYYYYEAVCPYGAYGEYQDEWMISPLIDLTGASNTQLSFYHDMTFWTWDTAPNYVMISTTDTNPSSFTTVWSIAYPDPDPNWSQVAIDLSAYDGQTIYIAWVYQSTWGEDWYVDDIVVSGDSGIIYEEHFDIDPFEETVIYDFIGIDITCTGDVGAVSATVNVVGKLKDGDMANYRHTQNAMRQIVTLDLNIEDGMEDDGSLGLALDAYMDCDTQTAYDIAAAANENGLSYGYWSHPGGYGWFFNPGDNGNN